MMEVPAIGEEIAVFHRTTDLANWNRYAAVNDEFIAMHMDDEAARRLGFPTAIGMGNLLIAYVHNLLRTWLGDTGRIVNMSCRFPAPNTRGMGVTVHGRVIAVDRRIQESFVSFDVWIEGQTSTAALKGEVIAVGSATIAI